MRETIKRYYALTKPRVTYGNALSAVAGFLFASRDGLMATEFIGLTVGITLVIAAACALNNHLDRDIDQLMERTKSRVSATGQVGGWQAVSFSLVLGVIGVALLAAFTNWLTVGVAIFGFVVYVYFYGMTSKRRSVHGTLVGSVSGAAPILAGYVAVTGTIDTAGLLLFVILFLWQMPEFYAIAIYRQKEYAAAKVPIMSVVKGIDSTRRQIFGYAILFVLASLLLTPYGGAGWSYLTVMAAVGAYWLLLSWRLLGASDYNQAARRVFRWSLVVLLVLCLMISLDPVLP